MCTWLHLTQALRFQQNASSSTHLLRFPALRPPGTARGGAVVKSSGLQTSRGAFPPSRPGPQHLRVSSDRSVVDREEHLPGGGTGRAHEDRARPRLTQRSVRRKSWDPGVGACCGVGAPAFLHGLQAAPPAEAAPPHGPVRSGRHARHPGSCPGEARLHLWTREALHALPATGQNGEPAGLCSPPPQLSVETLENTI